MEYCYITVHKNSFEIESTYNKAFVGKIKTVPAYKRSYDPDTKVWTINDKVFLSGIKNAAAELFPRAWVVEGAITTNLITGETVEQMALFQ